MLLMLLIAQGAAALPVVNFDLGKLAPAKQACNSGATPAGGEIVVCAKPKAPENLPIRSVPDELLLPKAEFKLVGKVRGVVAGERGNLGPIPTNRMMVTMSVPF